MSVLQLPTPDFRALFESLSAPYLVLTPDLTVVAVNRAFLQATLTIREAILGRKLFDVFEENPAASSAAERVELSESFAMVTRELRTDRIGAQRHDIRLPPEQGGGFEERHWSLINIPLVDPDGRLAFIIHAVEDVTAMVRLQQEEGAQSRLARELRGQAELRQKELTQHTRQLEEANLQLRVLKADLEFRVRERTLELLVSNDELRREADERKRAETALRDSEEQLRQSQKLEAVGRLAGGIAHDFNNILSVILSYSDDLLNRDDISEDIRPDLEEIKRAGERAAGLTYQMLAFSRQQVMRPTVLDLNEILTGLQKMLVRVLGEDIDITFRPGADLARVRADAGQIEQVVLNLAVNARDAMPSGGKLTLETSTMNLDEVYCRDHLGVSPGRYVMLAVSDTGVGMDKTVQTRLFEPFFTTKERGKGTGLGLSTVFGIIKQSRGNIWVYSEPGRGSTFRIYLPSVESTLTASNLRPVDLKPRGGTETILLVEDDDQIRKVAHSILKRAGYDVLDASEPDQALALCEATKGTIHLLLTDVVLPKMSGPQLAQRIAHLRPQIRVLFMSGYTDDAIFHHGVLESGVAFLQKPLTPDLVTRKVREVLDARPEETLA